jgi:hypothetical protein
LNGVKDLQILNSQEVKYSFAFVCSFWHWLEPYVLDSKTWT